MTKRPAPPPLPVQKPALPRSYPVLSLQSVIERIHSKCAPTVFTEYGEGEHTVIVLPEAWGELDAMIRVGKRRAVNRHEQVNIGMGHTMMTPDEKIIQIVSHFIYVYPETRGPAHASIAGSVDDPIYTRLDNEEALFRKYEKEMNRDGEYLLDPFLECGSSEVILLGHTHPGLGVFLSETDKGSNIATPGFPGATMVCDPYQKTMCAAVGVNCESAKVLVFSYAGDGGDRAKAAESADSLATLADVCGALLETPGAKGELRTYRGLDGKLHVKFKGKI